MILQALAELGKTLRKKKLIPDEGWYTAPVSMRIMIDGDGKLLMLASAKQEVERGKKTDYVSSLIVVPQGYDHTVKVKANFLCDTPTYLLGVDGKKNAKRAHECFAASKALHHDVLDKCDSRVSKAILNFFDSWDVDEAMNNGEVKRCIDDIKTGGNMIFCVDGMDAFDDAEIKKTWDEYFKKENESEDIPRGICLVTGKRVPIARLHPLIKGVRGAKSTGASMVSFNASAFESYGKTDGQGLNAPVGLSATWLYTSSLKYMLRYSVHNDYVGDTVIVSWARSAEPAYQILIAMLSNPSADKKMDDNTLHGMIHSILNGEPVDMDGIRVSPDEPFYILGLAPNAARLSVRFFLTNTFGAFIKNVMLHHQQMEIIQPFVDKPKFIPLGKLLKSTVNHNTKDSASLPLLAGELFSSVLMGRLYPEAMYQNILMRIFAETDEYNEKGTRTNPKIGYVRAAFIKAYLLRNKKGWEEKLGMTVNPNCKEISYVLGRLFSVLEEVQTAANPELNSTIKDRYFNSACATPASVFPTLFRLANAHLKKVGAQNKGREVNLNKKVQNLLSMIAMPDEGTPMPKRLSMEQQGAFILGYYQETQDRYTNNKGDKKDE
ncbi:MAG: type I-C CRISPR-associated protein Cas8c/Csd1 [Selenomonadaceae bacterium]